MHLGNLLLASAPCACHVMALLGSSLLFHASSKIRKTLGPFVQKVLRPPAGTLRGPTCSFTCVLQVKLALGLKTPQFLQQLLEGPKGPPGGPQEASKRPPCSHAPKRPPRGATCHREAPSLSGPVHFGTAHQSTTDQPSITHQSTINQPSINHQSTINTPSINHQSTINKPSTNHRHK